MLVSCLVVCHDKPDLAHEAKAVYGTPDLAHPGVAAIHQRGPVLLSRTWITATI